MGLGQAVGREGEIPQLWGFATCKCTASTGLSLKEKFLPYTTHGRYGLGTCLSIQNQGWAAVTLEQCEAGSQAKALLQGQRPGGKEGWEERLSLDKTKGEMLRSVMLAINTL